MYGRQYGTNFYPQHTYSMFDIFRSTLNSLTKKAMGIGWGREEVVSRTADWGSGSNLEFLLTVCGSENITEEEVERM